MPNPKLVCLNYLGSQAETENSVTGFNGTDARTTKTYSAGKFGNGADIPLTQPSASDQVTIDNVLVTSEGCVEAWLKLNWKIDGLTAGDGNSHIIWNNTIVPSVEFTSVVFIPGQGMHFDVFDGTNFRLTITNLNIPVNTLFHLSACWSETQQLQKVFVDRVQVGSITNTFNLTDTHTSNLALGKREDLTTVGLNGIIDNVKIWSFFQTDFSRRERKRFGMNDSIVLV